jgi:hypothetical protein
VDERLLNSIRPPSKHRRRGSRRRSIIADALTHETGRSFVNFSRPFNQSLNLSLTAPSDNPPGRATLEGHGHPTATRLPLLLSLQASLKSLAPK